MKIGFCVEGSTDRAVIGGLRDRWCPTAELVEGRFRGAFTRREIPKACLELALKGADVIIFMRDSNLEDWRKVQREDRARVDLRHTDLTVIGVCERNVECWLAADPHWLATELTCQDAAPFRASDPKAAVESALGVTYREKQEVKISQLVARAPLRRWLVNRSFEQFYDDLRQQSSRLGCQIENLREKSN